MDLCIELIVIASFSCRFLRNWACNFDIAWHSRIYSATWNVSLRVTVHYILS